MSAEVIQAGAYLILAAALFAAVIIVEVKGRNNHES